MQIDFAELDHGSQTRLIRARVDRICMNDPVLMEMLDIWRDNAQKKGVYVNQVFTTRIVETRQLIEKRY